MTSSGPKGRGSSRRPEVRQAPQEQQRRRAKTGGRPERQAECSAACGEARDLAETRGNETAIPRTRNVSHKAGVLMM